MIFPTQFETVQRTLQEHKHIHKKGINPLYYAWFLCGHHHMDYVKTWT